MKQFFLFAALTAIFVAPAQAALNLVRSADDISLIYQSGASIVIKPCEKFSIIRKIEDCKLKSGSFAERMAPADFEAAFKSLIEDYEPAEGVVAPRMFAAGGIDEVPAGIENYTVEKDLRFVDLNDHLASVREQIEEVKKFIEENEGLVDPEVTRRLEELELEAAGLEVDIHAVQSARAIITTLTTQFIAGTDIKKIINNGANGFTYQMLTQFRALPFFKADFSNVGDDMLFTTTEVTQLQWFRVMGMNPSLYATPDFCKDHIVVNGVGICPSYPVENVSYAQVEDFVKGANYMLKRDYYLLPSEEDWGKAFASARPGDDTDRRVDAGTPNEFGLFKMFNGVREMLAGEKIAHGLKTIETIPAVYKTVKKCRYVREKTVGERGFETAALAKKCEERKLLITAEKNMVVYKPNALKLDYPNGNSEIGFRLMRNR